jgi:ketol-acid reductoisomerase
VHKTFVKNKVFAIMGCGQNGHALSVKRRQSAVIVVAGESATKGVGH